MDLTTKFPRRTLPCLIGTVMIVIRQESVSRAVGRRIIRASRRTGTDSTKGCTFGSIACLIRRRIALRPIDSVTHYFINAAFHRQAILARLRRLFRQVVMTTNFDNITLVPLLFHRRVFGNTIRHRIEVAAGQQDGIHVKLRYRARIAAIF